jgi:hypothetical protein
MSSFTRQLQFGTRANPQMIPMFQGGPADISEAGYSSETPYLNGGAGVRNSVGGHMVYNLVWGPSHERDDIRPILDYANGLFDTTDNVELLYFIDPVAEDRNVLPMAWSFPAQGARDAIPLVADASGPLRPAQAPTPSNTQGYPARSAVYTLVGTETARVLYLPIPPGYCAWIGAMGSSTSSAGVQVTPFTGPTAGDVIPLTLLDVTDPSRFNVSVSTADAYTGLEIQLTVAAGTLTLSGLMVQMLPVGATPVTGGFISGQGHSGCEFSGKPVQSPYTIAPGLDRIGITARLVETGDWL